LVSNYSGGRDKEERGLKASLGKQLLRPSQKIHHKKRAGEWLKV
jgi:hypothetical protein